MIVTMIRVCAASPPDHHHALCSEVSLQLSITQLCPRRLSRSRRQPPILASHWSSVTTSNMIGAPGGLCLCQAKMMKVPQGHQIVCLAHHYSINQDLLVLD